jgi:UDP-2-acetamido-3-amino-2,3-dideoxy-glucuronate N-acetyltransferase
MAFTAHPTAIIDQGAQIGDNTRIWHWVHVCAGARVGRDCSIGQNVFIANRVTIGDNVRVQNNVSVYDDVTLEDDVFCGPSMVFTNVLNPRAHVPRKHQYMRTLVRRGASIGANATVICGHTIGEYAFIGAGAVVTHDVPAYALMVGTPARQVGWMCYCGVRLAPGVGASRIQCADCGRTYRLADGLCTPGA